MLLALRESPFYAEMGGQTADTGVVESESGKVRGGGRAAAGRGAGARGPAARRGDRGGRTGQGHASRRATGTTWPPTTPPPTCCTTRCARAWARTSPRPARRCGPTSSASTSPITSPSAREHLREIEELVNRRIVENHPVRTFTTSLEHARDLGAMALFGEKYGDFVRVVEIDDFSRELCGGTHVAWTSEVGAFKILSEGSVGANVRRIEAVSGRAAVSYYRERDLLVGAAASALGVTDDQVLPALARLQNRVTALEGELSGFVSRAAKDVVASLAVGGRAARRGSRGGGRGGGPRHGPPSFAGRPGAGNARSRASWRWAPSCRARPRWWSASAHR